MKFATMPAHAAGWVMCGEWPAPAAAGQPFTILNDALLAADEPAALLAVTLTV